MNQAIPENIGLDQREISTYQVLLKLGSASIREIATQNGINRGSTYETLKGVAGKDIVS